MVSTMYLFACASCMIRDIRTFAVAAINFDGDAGYLALRPGHVGCFNHSGEQHVQHLLLAHSSSASF